MFYRRRQQRTSTVRDPPEGTSADRARKESLYSLAVDLTFPLAMFTVGAIFYFLFATIFLLLLDIFSGKPSQLRLRVATASAHFVQELFPHSSISIKDLDQTVALLAGTTVLGFSLYSAATDAHYQKWRARAEAVESIELEQLRARAA